MSKAVIHECRDCGWRGRRVTPDGAYQPRPCPDCGSRDVYEQRTGERK